MFVRRGPAIVLSLVLGAAALVSVPSAAWSDGGAAKDDPRRLRRAARRPESKLKVETARGQRRPPRGRSAPCAATTTDVVGVDDCRHNGERLRPGRGPRPRGHRPVASGSSARCSTSTAPTTSSSAPRTSAPARSAGPTSLTELQVKDLSCSGPRRKVTRLRAHPQPGRAVPGDRDSSPSPRSSSARTSSPTAPRAEEAIAEARARPRCSPARSSHRRRRAAICVDGARRRRSPMRPARPHGHAATARRGDRRPGQHLDPRTARIVYSSESLDASSVRSSASTRTSCDVLERQGGGGCRDRRPETGPRSPTSRGSRRHDRTALVQIYTRIKSPEGEPLLFEAYYSLDEIESRQNEIFGAFRWITLGPLVLLILVATADPGRR